MDILSEALASMRTARPSSVRTDGRAPWGLKLPAVAGAGFHVVLHGNCWLVPADHAGESEPIPLGPGDVIFLRDGRAHVLADDPTTTAGEVVVERKGENSPIGRVRLGGGGAEASLLCGAYHLDQSRPHPMMAHFPGVIHLPYRPGRHPELSAAVELLRAELERPRLGSDGIVPTLIDSLLLYILRAWLDEQSPAAARGWIAALSDPGVAPALSAMHEDPGAGWTVQSLADEAGLSRAAFARRFTALIGEPPLAYLTRWRMTQASVLLRDGDLPLSAVAARAGYGSEFAFGKAFKREFGQSPGTYRRAVRPTAELPAMA